MKIFSFFALIFCSFIIGCSYLQPTIKVSEGDTSCQVDEDCLVISSECGDCDYTVINKVHKEEYERKYSATCENYKVACDAIYKAVPKCVANKCTFLHCEDLSEHSKNKEEFLVECNQYIAKVCSSHEECGPFSCVDDTIHSGVPVKRCLVKPFE